MKALLPNIIMGKGVVPPVPSNNNKVNDRAKNVLRLWYKLMKTYGNINNVNPSGIIKNIKPEEVTSIKESLEPCGIDT